MTMAGLADSWSEETAASYCVVDKHAPDMPIVELSDGFQELTGYTREEMVGKVR
jgi:hypothetical protein